MKSHILIRELAAYLRTESVDYVFPAPENGQTDVKIFEHGLPDELGEEVYPFVVIRWMEGRIEDEQSQTLAHETVGLVLGVYAPRDMAEAGRLMAELLDAVRQSLWRQPLLAKLFQMEQPLRAAIPDPKDRWNQYHLATVEVTYNYLLPSRGLGKEASQQWKKSPRPNNLG